MTLNTTEKDVRKKRYVVNTNVQFLEPLNDFGKILGIADLGQTIFANIASYNSVDNFLKNSVPENFRSNVKEAFGSDIKVTTLSKDVVVYRYSGGESATKSYWYAPNQTSNSAADLKLPPGNSYEQLNSYIILKGSTILEGTVAPNFGQLGGGYQYYIPDPSIVISRKERKMKKSDMCLKLILEIKKEANNELSKIALGQEREVTAEQINSIIIPEMLNLEMAIKQGTISKDLSNRYIISFAYAFKVWNWNMQKPSKLYLLLLELNTLYKEL